MESVLATLQGKKEFDSSQKEAIQIVSEYIGKTTDKEAIILKAHLLTERFLIAYIETHCKNPKALENAKLSFKQLMQISKSFHDVSEKEWLWELLDKLNGLRNKFAHNLLPDDSNDSIDLFLRISKKRIEAQGYFFNDSDLALKQVLVQLCGVCFNFLNHR